MTVTNVVNETLYKHLTFDFARDIVPVASTIQSANVMEVNLSVPAHTVPEFIAYAKANPGKINYASLGYGTAPNMAAELFKMMTGVNMVQVPYRGSYMTDLMGGRVQVAFTPIPQTIANIRAGKLRALAVTGATPSDALPDVPTVATFVPGYEATIWHGIGAPKGTPLHIVNSLHKEINAILGEPATKATLANLGAEPMPMTRPEFDKFVAAQIDKWGKVVRFADIKIS
jgi:tripartite-type tricarboxylate transporter receptor subunit TctC